MPVIYTCFSFKQADHDKGGQLLRSKADEFFSNPAFGLAASQWAHNEPYGKHCLLLAFDRPSSPLPDVREVLSNVPCAWISWVGSVVFDDKYRFDQFVIGYVGYSINKVRIPLLPDLPGYPSIPPKYSGYWRKAS
ncbi:hypothetical protein [Stutzerimonas stutzeri]|jgi:hypothetical protein|uniref:hypothetical protein n=1 Tax=Stutzerimonas stutzeri TaxID=316 RepID=UPI0012FC5382|nr:hypothetical protein [Stutzerimonas stutzeri]